MFDQQDREDEELESRGRVSAWKKEAKMAEEKDDDDDDDDKDKKEVTSINPQVHTNE